MKLLITISYLILLLTVLCSAQEKSLLRLEQFPVSRDLKGKPIRINLNSHPKAHLYRTMLRDNVKKGINFAGHYTLAT